MVPRPISNRSSAFPPDRLHKESFSPQDEISAHVVDELKLTLLGGIPKAAEVDARAYDLHLQAKYLIEQFDLGEIEALEQAESLLNHALKIEPNYVAPLFQSGRLYGRQEDVLRVLTREEVRARRQAITDRVMGIDRNSAAACFWQGFMAL
jgi:hypothetical protein